MIFGDRIYQDYIAILKEELMPAMGCTGHMRRRLPENSFLPCPTGSRSRSAAT